jgi:hypothetical protein
MPKKTKASAPLVMGNPLKFYSDDIYLEKYEQTLLPRLIQGFNNYGEALKAHSEISGAMIVAIFDNNGKVSAKPVAGHCHKFPYFREYALLMLEPSQSL